MSAHMTAARLTELIAVFRERVGAEILEGTENVTETQARFLLRIPKGPPTTGWLSIVDRLLELGDQQLATKAPTWTIDVSKQYFRRPDLRYGWRLILQSKELATYLPALAKDIKSIQLRVHQLEEVRLNGSPTRRVSKGYADKVLVGPLALRGQ